jgi:hypothetical protein
MTNHDWHDYSLHSAAPLGAYLYSVTWSSMYMQLLFTPNQIASAEIEVFTDSARLRAGLCNAGRADRPIVGRLRLQADIG